MNGVVDPVILEELLNVETGLVVLKWLYVVMFGLYLLFSLVVLTQIRQMLASLNGQADKAILLVGWMQVILAAAALVTAIMIL